MSAAGCSPERRKELNAELKTVLNEKSSTHVAERIIDWYATLRDGEHAYAERYVYVARLAGHPGLPPTGEIVYMDHRDQSVKIEHSQVAGSQINSDGAKLISQQIQNFKGQIEESGKLDARGAELFRQALDEAEGLSDLDECKELIADLDRLRQELAKPEPKTSIVKKVWGGIVTLGGGLKAVKEIGIWIGSHFPGLVEAIT